MKQRSKANPERDRPQTVFGQRPKTVAELSDPTKVERPHFQEFTTDFTFVSVTDAELNAKKDQLAADWLGRAEVQAILPSSLSNQQFVQKLEFIAGVTLANEGTLITNLNNGSQTRAQVLRAVAESTEVTSKFLLQNFVTMQYIGHLRRDRRIVMALRTQLTAVTFPLQSIPARWRPGRDSKPNHSWIH